VDYRKTSRHPAYFAVLTFRRTTNSVARNRPGTFCISARSGLQRYSVSRVRESNAIDAAGTAFASTADLASALRRAEAAHGEHEAHRLARCGLARLVRRVHGGGAGRQSTAVTNSGYDIIVISGARDRRM
jgi:hypothetical protein